MRNDRIPDRLGAGDDLAYPLVGLPGIYLSDSGGRVSLIGLLIFGTGGLTIVYWIAPRFNQWLGKKEGRNEEIIAFLLLALFLIDVCYSILHPNQGAGITAPAGAVLAMRP